MVLPANREHAREGGSSPSLEGVISQGKFSFQKDRLADTSSFVLTFLTSGLLCGSGVRAGVGGTPTHTDLRGSQPLSL